MLRMMSGKEQTDELRQSWKREKGEEAISPDSRSEGKMEGSMNKRTTHVYKLLLQWYCCCEKQH